MKGRVSKSGNHNYYPSERHCGKMINFDPIQVTPVGTVFFFVSGFCFLFYISPSQSIFTAIDHLGRSLMKQEFTSTGLRGHAVV